MLINFSKNSNPKKENRQYADWRFFYDCSVSSGIWLCQMIASQQFVDSFFSYHNIEPSEKFHGSKKTWNFMCNNISIVRSFPFTVFVYFHFFPLSLSNCVWKICVFGRNNIATWGVNFCCHHYYCLGMILSQIHQKTRMILKSLQIQ